MAPTGAALSENRPGHARGQGGGLSAYPACTLRLLIQFCDFGNSVLIRSWTTLSPGWPSSRAVTARGLAVPTDSSTGIKSCGWSPRTAGTVHVRWVSPSCSQWKNNGPGFNCRTVKSLNQIEYFDLFLSPESITLFKQVENITASVPTFFLQSASNSVKGYASIMRRSNWPCAKWYFKGFRSHRQISSAELELWMFYYSCRAPTILVVGCAVKWS